MGKKSYVLLVAAIVCGVIGTANASYYILWNGADVNDVTMNVGETATVIVGSTDTTLPGPDFWWGNGYIRLTDNSYSNMGQWDTVAALPAAGPGALITVYSPPYEEAVDTFVYTPSPGDWFELTYFAAAEGDVTLTLGWHADEGGQPNWTEQDFIVVTQLPASEPCVPPLPDMAAHWVADFAVVEDVNKVAGLLDQSGNGFDMVDGYRGDPCFIDSDFRPAIDFDALNGHDVMVFNGGQFMDFYDAAVGNDPNWTNAQDYTFVVVYNPYLPAGEASYRQEYIFSVGYGDIDSDPCVASWSAATMGTRVHHNNYGGVNYYYEDGFASQPDDIKAGEQAYMAYDYDSMPSAGWRVMSVIWGEEGGVPVGGDVDAYVGFNRGAPLPAWVGNGDAGTTDYVADMHGVSIGMYSRWFAGTEYEYFYNGEVAEVRIYKGALTRDQQKQVAQELRLKYGLVTCADIDELQTMGADWLTGEFSWVDYNLDGVIDLFDYATLGSLWLSDGNPCP